MRPTIQQTMLDLAEVLARRAMCAKYRVGCVLTAADHTILAAAYNGPAAGLPHCTPANPCKDFCRGSHAESNALLRCTAPRAMIYRCYTNWSPCLACCKQLIQTGCFEIVFLEKSDEHDKAQEFWRSAGRVYRQFTGEKGA